MSRSDPAFTRRRAWRTLLKRAARGRKTLARALDGFARAREGVAAVEFAMLAPLLVGIYLGTVEVVNLVSASRKANTAAATIADIVAQNEFADNSLLGAVFDAIDPILAPLDATNAAVRVTAVIAVPCDRSSNPSKEAENLCFEVDWSASSNQKRFAARKAGSRVEIDALREHMVLEFSEGGVLSEIEYEYVPGFSFVLSDSFQLHNFSFTRPRLSNKVSWRS